jgi:hypothetical protein
MPETDTIITDGLKYTTPNMKTLPIHRDEKKDRANVDCATGTVSIYRACAYCAHCKGVHVGTRVYPPPQERAYSEISRGAASDEALMNAAMQFNSLVRDGNAIECDDDDNRGFRTRYQN